VGKIRFKGHGVLLAMPLTFMNLSGVAVAELVNSYGIDLTNLLVVCDDLDLEAGRVKIKPGGSSGGHHGLKSIIDSLETNDFSRLRIGIGKPPLGRQTSDYVLCGFSKQEKTRVKEAITKAVDCCALWLTAGIDEAMNIFNTRSKNSDI
jgi:PTH1 family peptidyl-tRNA hydrolase